LFLNLRKQGTPVLFGDAGEGKGVAQDADIGVAVGGDTIKIERSSSYGGESVAEGEVMDSVSAVDESTVYIEEVGIKGIPRLRKAHATTL
jgi:hypothetical protein